MWVEQPDIRIGERPQAGRLVDAHRSVNRALAGLLDVILELDTPESRLANNATSMADWIQYDLGLDTKTARAWVRVAKALAELPKTKRAFEDGALSFDEVGVLCRYATPENEDALLELARFTELKDLGAAVRKLLDVKSPPRKPRDDAWMEMWRGEDVSVLKLRGEIPGIDGVLVETMLRRVASQQPPDPATGLFRDSSVRAAEALVQLASAFSAEDADHDRATVVLHVPSDDFTQGRVSGMPGRMPLDEDDILRAACESRIQPAIDDPAGFTVGIGRTSRVIPAWLRRLVEDRDDGCRFPGCGRTRWTQIHHIIHWAHGGPTNLDNLIVLCGFHHRLVHRRGWQLVGNPNGQVAFLDQWANEFRPARHRFGEGHGDQLLRSIDHYRDSLLEQVAPANGPP